ncbi:hypothetical protein FHS49_001004 [Sphingobium boeckii]|uniref:Uncharacterized protein n=1 Tax=Sphingobium boeckii TaxID=1082345 RepID=A0A7W9AG12_9SPHN|nr:hypothetical protein [Sphingobium boeckii]
MKTEFQSRLIRLGSVTRDTRAIYKAPVNEGGLPDYGWF